jgi:hypothetical protein
MGKRWRLGRWGRVSVVGGVLLAGVGVAAVPAFADFAGHGSGYVWLDNPSTPVGVSHVPAVSYQANSTGRTNTVVRQGTGTYSVRFPGLGSGGTALVTAYGGSSERPDDRCKILSWSTTRSFPSSVPTTTISVGCFTQPGAPVDSLFTASYTFPLPGSVTARAAYLRHDRPTATVGGWTTPSPSFNSRGGGNRVFHQARGEYLVHLPGLGHPPKQGNFQVQVTAFGRPSADPSAWCDLEGDVGDEATGGYLVYCTDARGRAIDSGFTLTAVEGAGHLLRAGPSSSADIGCDHGFCSAGSNTPAVTVNVIGPGFLEVRLPVDMNNGNVQVTTWFAAGDPQPTRGRCKISSWGGRSVFVTCHNQFGAEAEFTTFTVGFAA